MTAPPLVNNFHARYSLMNFGKKVVERTYTLDKAGRIAGTVLSIVHPLGLWHMIKAKTSILLPIVSILALATGVFLGAISETLSDVVNRTVSTFVAGYGFFAPVLIFMVLAPVLSRIFSTKQRGKFGLYVVGWLAVTKIVALLWATLFTFAVFGLPLFPEHSSSIGGAFATTSKTLLSTLSQSPLFMAIYAAIITGVIALKIKGLANLLEKGVAGIEHIGQYLQPLIPVFMLAVGVYIQSLPTHLVDQIGLEGTETSFQTLNILGLQMNPNTTTGMVTAYVVGALLVAVACFVFHFGILALAKYKVKRFSIINYFKHYWVKAYPLLWSTSSESLATPLNLYILKKNAPYVRPTVRRLVVGVGSALCTNGTLICVVILIGLVGGIMGLRFSVVELLLCIPVAFLISFGIPGVPGELLLFAGPVSLILHIPPEMLPMFLALYLGLQLGLPDSFRTGANTTNNYVYCIMLNEVYEKRFLAEKPRGEE